MTAAFSVFLDIRRHRQVFSIPFGFVALADPATPLLLDYKKFSNLVGSIILEKELAPLKLLLQRLG
jgi:hypothetical protein